MTSQRMTPGQDVALAAYLRGDFGGAIAAQTRALTEQQARNSATARDSLMLGLYLHAAGRVDVAIDVLSKAIATFPDDASLRENLGALYGGCRRHDEAIAAYQQALSLGSSEANVHDGLCESYGGKGDMAGAIKHGRLALEAKDRRFGARPPAAVLPAEPAPMLDPHRPQENVISYSLWGTSPRYLVPLQENLRIARHLFPAWTVRIYLDAGSPEALETALRQAGADVRRTSLPEGMPPFRRLLWRFHVISDPTVKRFLARDADALLSVKERVAVDDWLASGKHFHMMRDYYTHTDLVLAGMWGGVGGILPPVDLLMKEFRPFRVENNHIDQDLLSDRVWPTIRSSCLIHDSVFTGCLGSVRFPPYGALQPGRHIGQSFLVPVQKPR
jgi:tetratricopeptide (TPR) repeat protein